MSSFTGLMLTNLTPARFKSCNWSLAVCAPRPPAMIWVFFMAMPPKHTVSLVCFAMSSTVGACNIRSTKRMPSTWGIITSAAEVE